MASDNDLIQKQIEQNVINGPHVVILGAGATIAAIPDGDKNKLKSSVMNDFIRNLHMEDLMKGINLRTRSRNLEAIYSELCEHPEYDNIREEMEQRIYSFYSSLIIPDEPTAYDYLILSLRSKDSIFTFNWDNLLIQAYARCQRITKNLPQMYFLHGNVSVSYCEHCHILQNKENVLCVKCKKPLTPTQLLYPVKQKDYTSSEYLQGVWGQFKEELNRASVLTVFGYGAPRTDVEAFRIMKKAFAPKMRWYDHFEVIDVKPREEIYRTWTPFIKATHGHFQYYQSIFEATLMTEFPRRSIEGYVKRYLSSPAWFGTSGVQIHKCKDFSELYELLKPLLDQEDEGDFSVIPLRHSHT